MSLILYLLIILLIHNLKHVYNAFWLPSAPHALLCPSYSSQGYLFPTCPIPRLMTFGPSESSLDWISHLEPNDLTSRYTPEGNSFPSPWIYL